ncbi:MAG: S-layer homology domain-containing protein [Peptoniphilus harei]|nr:S-layer homology domain-containing protein [Peptoniphilus harei]
MNKKLITTITLSAILLAPVSIFAKDFTDVNKNDWFYSTVNELSDKGVITGYEDKTFKPQKSVTYSEFLTLLNNSIGTKQAPDYKNPTQWYQPTFDYLKSKGVITNISNPNQPISRNEMAKYLSLGLEKLKNQTPNTTAPTQIKDFSTIPAEYKDYVASVVNAELIKGDEHQNFNGSKSLTRAETAVIIKGLGGGTQEAKKPDPKPVADEKGLQLTDPSKPMVWREKMERKYVRQPQEGDVVIKADGTRVTLKLGAAGVLGAGQNVDIYSGFIKKDGTPFKEGDLADNSWYSLFGQEGLPGGDNKMSMGGQPYSVDHKTGEAHFDFEWQQIRAVGATQPPIVNENMDEVPWEKVVKPGERPMTVKDPLTGKVYTPNGQYEWTGAYWQAIMR